MLDSDSKIYGEDADKLEKAFLVIRSNLDDLTEEQVLKAVKKSYQPGILLSALILEASDGKCAPPMVLRGARAELGLSVSQMASVLETDPQTIRRMEQTPLASTFRKPASRMIRLLRAYLNGYRPADWPAGHESEETSL